MTFKQWLKSITMIVSTEEQEIIDNIFLSSEFPDTVEKYPMLDYLNSNSSNQAVISFRSLYSEYIKFISRETPNA